MADSTRSRTSIAPEQQAELDTLVDAELRAATARTAALCSN
jgi:hypothetical protein